MTLTDLYTRRTGLSASAELLVITGASRKSRQKLAKIMAEICDSRKIYNEITASQSSQNMGTKPL